MTRTYKRGVFGITLLFALLITGCIKYDTSGIKDNGKWVSIYDAPVTCSYILHNDSVYGICFDNPDSINWDTLWSEPHFYPIDNVDVKTLFININDRDCRYAKDHKYVYCPIVYWCFDTEVKVMYTKTFDGDIRIPGADPETFKYLGDGYAVDKNGMYSCGEKIEWSDSIIAHYANSI